MLLQCSPLFIYSSLKFLKIGYIYYKLIFSAVVQEEINPQDSVESQKFIQYLEASAPKIVLWAMHSCIHWEGDGFSLSEEDSQSGTEESEEGENESLQ